MQECVYKKPMAELKRQFVKVWAKLEQTTVDRANDSRPVSSIFNNLYFCLSFNDCIDSNLRLVKNC